MVFPVNERTFVIGIYGRMTEADEWIQLATLEETINLKPNEANTPKLSAAFSDGCGVSCNAQTGALETTSQRLNAPEFRPKPQRRSNLTTCAGALPTHRALSSASTQVRFNSNRALSWESLRQVVLLENLLSLSP